MPNDIEIKTRLGLILEKITAAALKGAGIKFCDQPVYDGACEIPDFAIPDADNPTYVVEVHQTDRRNSFQMKVLRAFTAVAEAKAHWGKDIVSVNVLFGDADPDEDREVPASNVRAMFGYFDVSVIPKNVAGYEKVIGELEASALHYASLDEDSKEKAVAAGSKAVIDKHAYAVSKLGDLLESILNGAKAKTNLFPLWEEEATRLVSLGVSPLAGDTTFYKRSMVRSLYLSDKDFDELYSKKDPCMCSDSVKKQLVITKLATVEEGLCNDGSDDVYTLDELFDSYIKDPNFGGLRKLCQERLFESPEMRWFFDDIRGAARRLKMATIFLSEVNSGTPVIDLLRTSYSSDCFQGVDHARCWVIDLFPIMMGLSHNSFNQRMFSHVMYDQRLGNPYNNLAIRSPRLGVDPDKLTNYLETAAVCIEESLKGFDVSNVTASGLAEDLLSFRLYGAARLQKMNPLHLILEGVCHKMGVKCDYQSEKSILSDLTDPSDPVGSYVAFVLELNGRKVLCHTLSTQDSDGDHKSKEWGARRTALLYRLPDSGFEKNDYDASIFVLDGEWDNKDTARLHRCGWDYVVRMGVLEETLRGVFELSAIGPGTVTPLPELSDEGDDLPMAAEEE